MQIDPASSQPAPALLRFALPRRRLLLLGLAGAARAAGAADEAQQPLAMHWPRDHGSHPDFNTEWWYVTGHAQQADGRLFGFQITFFRSRVEATQEMASKFAARQLLFAHAAVTDVAAKRLLHDQRIARAGFGIAEAATDDAAIRLRDWSLKRDAGGDGAWLATVASDDFALDLKFSPTQPVLLQGVHGISRKGPLAENVSHYYSQPQLAVGGRVRVGSQRFDLPSSEADGPTRYPLPMAAWLDREWSNAYLHPDAVGWDWIGMNLDDGAALMAFQIRRRDGGVLWDGGSFRSAAGELRVFERGETRWQAVRRWTSAASGAVYPVEWTLQIPGASFGIHALIDNQELDSRGSTGAIYWEGLSDLLDTSGRRAGRGYLEMTGYASALRL